MSNILTGASLIYERHSIYKSLSDFQLSANASRALYHDEVFKCRQCAIDLAVFNGDILLAGHVPSAKLRQEAQKRIAALQGYRRLFNQLAIRRTDPNYIQDSWITAKIRAQILADARINPKKFKVITADRIVYLMGDVIPLQATLVIDIARQCVGVKRVVKLLRYYNLSNHAIT
nr:BON domain-containing protein [Legionella londiniensis]